MHVKKFVPSIQMFSRSFPKIVSNRLLYNWYITAIYSRRNKWTDITRSSRQISHIYSKLSNMQLCSISNVGHDKFLKCDIQCITDINPNILDIQFQCFDMLKFWSVAYCTSQILIKISFEYARRMALYFFCR